MNVAVEVMHARRAVMECFGSRRGNRTRRLLYAYSQIVGYKSQSKACKIFLYNIDLTVQVLIKTTK